MGIHQRISVRHMRAWNQFGDIKVKVPVQEIQLVTALYTHLEFIHRVFGDHNVDALRVNGESHLVSHLGFAGGLDHDLVLAGLHRDLIVYSLKHHGGNFSLDNALSGRGNLDVLRPQHGVNHGAVLHVIHTGELRTAETHLIFSCHNAVKNITLPDKVRHKGIPRLVVDILRLAHLLDSALRHNHNLVGHGQRLLLVVGHIDKGDTQLVMHTLQFQLHLLAHL